MTEQTKMTDSPTEALNSKDSLLATLLLTNLPSNQPSQNNKQVKQPKFQGQKTTVRKKIQVAGRYLVLETKYQLLIVILVALVAFVVSRQGSSLSTAIRIPNEIATAFFSAISQSLAALIALLIAMIIFILQIIDQKRTATYTDFKAEIDKITDLFINSLTGPKSLNDPILFIIDSYKSIKMKDLPSEWAEHDSPSWEDAKMPFIKEWQRIKDQLPSKSGLPYLQILLIMERIDNIIDRVDIVHIALISMELLIKSISKFSILLIASLLLILFSGTDDLHGTFPDFTITVISATITWTALVFLEIILHIRDTYRDFQDGF